MRIILLTLLLLTLISLSPCLAGSPAVLFDQGHGQAFTIEKQGELQLGKLADTFRASGWQVASSTHPFSDALLANVDALVISGAFKALDAKELAAVGKFLNRGGRLAVMLHIAPPMVELLGKLGVASANGVVRESNTALILDEQPLNFKVTDLQYHPLTRNLDSFSLYGGWPLMPIGKNARAIAQTSSAAWVDLNNDDIQSLKDAMQAFAVIVTGTVGKGEFTVFADDAIFQNRFLTGTNKTLADNLSRWMMRGRTQSGVDI
ncbi:MAG: DUF4350 domain-containing protein [Desulfuromonas sp.]|nr:MAG: DUF4350 domain-containing protein [Desulfuromonas sp.]